MRFAADIFRALELGSEGEDSFVAGFVLRSDIDDEGGTDVGKGGGVKNFERAMRFAFDGQSLESGEEAAFVAKLRCVVVVGMAGFPVRDDDSLRPQLAN